MKTPESAKYLNVLLNFLGLLVILSLIGFISHVVTMESVVGVGNLILTFYGGIYLLALLIVVVILKRVVGTIIFARNPLVEENVIRFRRAAYIFFALGTFEFIVIGIARMVTEGNPFSFGFVFSLFIGCIILVLADVFKFAIKIKEENDLTV
ncbi:hypothetical protein Amet_2103 [Alkaliphilus metalliredigens QYMF]|uniref:DUF2975 domain-containing protein n=1 Tax=Alkaliphilus metalliredigens (strain QYMF) TaxID=293826 RepID=A6TPZ5_ALKMQ|nr:DUF2975 domain-containing protein [Alkaliphilus metalliredigens]ABR48263.1 hypothetical protein Amet_2103 [Alkaliphilus metalliredigens QYMF]